MYVIVYLICIGLFELSGVRTDNSKTRKYCLQMDSKPLPSAYGATALTIALLYVDQVSIEQLKADRVFTRVCHLNSPVTRGICSKIISRVLLSNNFYIVLLFDY